MLYILCRTCLPRPSSCSILNTPPSISVPSPSPSRHPLHPSPPPTPPPLSGSTLLLRFMQFCRVTSLSFLDYKSRIDWDSVLHVLYWYFLFDVLLLTIVAHQYSSIYNTLIFRKSIFNYIIFMSVRDHPLSFTEPLTTLFIKVCIVDFDWEGGEFSHVVKFQSENN